MPSRRSKNFATEIRREAQNPEVLSTMAEFTEPYGAMASANRIREGSSDPMNYAGALPVIGAPARFAKGKKLAELIRPLTRHLTVFDQPSMAEVVRSRFPMLEFVPIDLATP